MLNEKILFGVGGSIASFLFFFIIGYLAKFFSKYSQDKQVWKIINLFIIMFMSFLTFLVFLQIFN
jgi:L-lysine exporter family protein LysE/ArgO